MKFEDIGLQVPTILLPKEGTDLAKWAVIACDQYTSQPEYWEKVKEITVGSPTTLDLIYPEVYLESDKKEEIIASINETMERYLEEGTLVEQKPGFILLDRKTSEVESRKGLVVALDLDQYDYSEGSKTLIRATEGTIVDRLPPRIRVREGASIELPHIMVLIDDPNKTVIEPLFEKDLEKAYDFDLMENGGHLSGWRVDEEADLNEIAEKLRLLAGESIEDALLFAMGDGNHSFATAKAIWEKLKEEAGGKEAIMDHPARYALVELVNVHDQGLEFEAIHRVVFGVNPEDLLQKMEEFLSARGAELTIHPCADLAETKEICGKIEKEDRHLVTCVTTGGFCVLAIDNPGLVLDVASLQGFLDEYLSQQEGAEIDYIHGEEVVTDLGSKPGNIGFYLPSISKHDLFPTILRDGALPRKTFSMGEADEKRFYLECRKIKV